jgi:hypothetical protein
MVGDIKQIRMIGWDLVKSLPLISCEPKHNGLQMPHFWALSPPGNFYAPVMQGITVQGQAPL